MFAILVLACATGFGQEWNTNFEMAKKNAQEKKQKIILVFSGSDWCAPCMKLEREIWNSETFKNYSKENYTLLKADFPKRKKNALTADLQDHNNQLAERYNKNGFFPLVVVLDEKGKALGQVGYKKSTPREYIELINSFQ